MNQIDFANGIEVQKYFDEVIRLMNGVKISSVFSLGPSFSISDGVRQYMEDTEIYILFENGKCLVIDYPFIDALSADIRSISAEEYTQHQNLSIKDFFNDRTVVHVLTEDDQAIPEKTCKISLEYDSLVGVDLEFVTKSYSKWIEGDLLFDVAPKATTFSQLLFKMANGKSFVICPGDAIIDGYTFVWSDDAKELVKEL